MHYWRQFKLVSIAILMMLVGAASAQQPVAGPAIIVFAAASLKTALDTIVMQWTKDTGQVVRVSYASSSVLAKQIEQGAPAAIFISADLDWMDYVAKRDLIVADSRSNLLQNELVLIAPKGQSTAINIKPGFDLKSILRGGRLAVGEVSSVPAGKYGKAALEHLQIWTSVADALAQTENVRAALLLVAGGEATAGIVYKTDAASEPKVEILGNFPKDSYPPIIYPMAMLKGVAAEGSVGFLGYLRTASAKIAFEKEGFLVMQ